MITDILEYVDGYDNVRAACGLNSYELTNNELQLVFYSNQLNILMNTISGVYPEGQSSETLEVIFARLTSSDIMYLYIQSLAIYAVADYALTSVGLKAFKTQADGKATLTRFSPESTYQDTLRGIKERISYYTGKIYELFGETTTVIDPVAVVTPVEDLVTGE